MSKKVLKLCTICARKGSKGVKNKNLTLINGKPLIYFTIKQAIQSKIFDKIVVSTDCSKIKRLANKYGADCWFLRSKNLAKDNSPKKKVIKDLLIRSEKKFNKIFEIIVDLDVCCPLRIPSDIKKAVKIFSYNKSKILVSVSKSRRNPFSHMVMLKNKKLSRITKFKKKYIFRQKTPEIYELNSSIHIRRRSELLKNNINYFDFSKKISHYKMPHERSIDLDSSFDLKLIKLLKNDQFKK